jgi:hypothetical protein
MKRLPLIGDLVERTNGARRQSSKYTSNLERVRVTGIVESDQQFGTLYAIIY